MKKAFLFALVAWLCSQTPAYALPALNVFGGANFGDAKVPADISSETRTGYFAGINADIPLGSVFYLQPGLTYLRRSFEVFKVGDFRFRADVDSLQFPLYLKAKFGERVSPFVFAGPAATYNFNKNYTGNAGSTYRVDVHSFDLSTDIGAGLEFAPVFITAKYSLAVTDLSKEGGSLKANGFQIYGGFAFTL